MASISSNPFRFLTDAELATMRADYLACVTAIGVGNQSYTINNRQFTRADLNAAKETLGEVLEAIEWKAGRGARTAQARNW